MRSKVSNGYRETAESLTGGIPIFLKALAEINAQEPVTVLPHDDDEWWERVMESFLETEPVTAMRQDVAKFYSQTRRRLQSTHKESWRV